MTALRFAVPVNVWLPAKIRLGVLGDAPTAVKLVELVAFMLPAPKIVRFDPGVPVTLMIFAVIELLLVRLFVLSVSVPLALMLPVVVIGPEEVNWNVAPPLEVPKLRLVVPVLTM